MNIHRPARQRMRSTLRSKCSWGRRSVSWERRCFQWLLKMNSCQILSSLSDTTLFWTQKSTRDCRLRKTTSYSRWEKWREDGIMEGGGEKGMLPNAYYLPFKWHVEAFNLCLWSHNEYSTTNFHPLCHIGGVCRYRRSWNSLTLPRCFFWSRLRRSAGVVWPSREK